MNLNIELKKNTNYLQAGTLLSRVSLIKEYFKKEQGIGKLVVVHGEKNLSNFIKIGDFLGLPLDQITNIADIVDLLYNYSGFFITSDDLFHIHLPNIQYLETKFIFPIHTKNSLSPESLSKVLNEYGYKHNEHRQNGSFQILGDTLSIIPYTGEREYKISFWGDIVEDILILENNQSIKKNTLYIGKIEPIDFSIESEEFNYELREKCNIPEISTFFDSIDFYKYYDELTSNFDHSITFNSLAQNRSSSNQVHLGVEDLFIENIEDFKTLLENKSYNHIFILSKNGKAIKNFLEYNNLFHVQIIESHLNMIKSFKIPQKGILAICDDNISRIFIKKRTKKSMSKKLDLLLQIKPGDFIVHVDHGIGVFKEIITKVLPSTNNKEIKKEYIELQYKNNDKLFVPITEVSRINKYVGVENPKLTPLSSNEWEKKLKKVGENIEQVAGELLEIYAKREMQKGFAFASLPEEELKFIHSFSYTHTSDQIQIIQEIFTDMESDKPMDRLVSGDVGFGKTEIAFQAIYKAIINNKQAALISPLIVLAYEHFEKAKERFHDFPFNIEVITRFEKAASIKSTLERLKNGQIDLIIGTHRLLSEDIQFKDLGLLVIDEEHKFGVKDKEKIKKMKGNLDILALSATPIPRSLNMALNGIKSISMLTTPPEGRQSIETLVSKFDEKVIGEAGKREFERGGQIFFIHNRVETIESMQYFLSKTFPNKKIIIAHGQLSGDTLEKRIISFKKKEAHILLATTVIENGIDFPNVNTIFINDSYNFGISQIHQLRGRVGRSDKKGFCYLLYNKDSIKEDAARRLKTIVDYSHLGAGFELAIKDLEIRGGGDILGIRQSGQKEDIGVNLYIEMLENKIEQLKNQQTSGPVHNESQGIHLGNQNGHVSIDLNISAYIPDLYFGSELDKLNFYREIESLETQDDLKNIIDDFKEINEDIPLESNNFFNLLSLKLYAASNKITVIKKVGINYQIDFSTDIQLEELKNFLDKDKEVKFKVVSLNKLRSERKNFENEEKFIQYLLQLFEGNIGKKKLRLKKI